MNLIKAGNKDSGLNKLKQILRSHIKYDTNHILAKEYLPKKNSSKLDNRPSEHSTSKNSSSNLCNKYSFELIKKHPQINVALKEQ